VRSLISIVVEKLISVSSIVLSTRGSFLQTKLLKLLGVRVSGLVFFGRRVMLSNPHNLVLGKRVAIGDNAVIVCHAPISIGEDFIAAPGLYLNSGGHDPNIMVAFGRPITIGKRVWCGVRTTILAGVEIGDDAVIGAGSVVVSAVPPCSIVAGVPARVIGQVKRDLSNFQYSKLG